MWKKIMSFFSGEDAWKQEILDRMAVDQVDPRKAFVWGVLAASYSLDPAYNPEHAKQVLRDGYSVSTAEQLLRYTANSFKVREHIAYNQYRLCWLARAGFGAGLLTEAESWGWAFREAALVQKTFTGWIPYAEDHLLGQLAFRRSMGDTPEKIEEIRRQLTAAHEKVRANEWSKISFHTKLS